MRRTVLLPGLLVALVIALAAALWLTRSDARTPGVGSEEGRDTSSPSDAPLLEGVGGAAIPSPTADAGGLFGVVRRGGVPAPAHVEVRYVAAVGDQFAYTSLARERLLVALTTGGAPTFPVAGTAEARVDGTFTVEGLEAGQYLVLARTEDMRGTVAAVLPDPAARVAVAVDLTPAGRSLRGRVVHADGSPFRGQVVAGSGPGTWAWGFLLGTRGETVATDEEGRFTWEGLGAGEVKVTAFGAGILAVWAPVPIEVDRESVLTLAEETRTLRGRVVTAGREKPVSNAQVFVTSRHPVGGFTTRRALTDAEGRIEVATAPGPVSVHAPARGNVEIRLAEADGAPR